MVSNQNKYQSRSLLAFRWLSILVLVFRGVLTLCFLFPLLSSEKKNREIKRWSNALLRTLNVRLEVDGIKNLPATPFLLVSNHISWLDIQLLNAYKPISFVAKSEVARWPIFGWMAKQLGTLFIKRGDSKHARMVVGRMTIALREHSICIFPEGTSTAGDKVLLFKPNLFEAAIQAKVPVYPLAIEYFCQETGLRSQAPAFIGDMGLLESISNILKSPGLRAVLTFLPPIESTAIPPIDRKWLSQHCYDSISGKVLQV
jgi:1-acyl-sn-glycerol-3-phosphate acyltransferase